MGDELRKLYVVAPHGAAWAKEFIEGADARYSVSQVTAEQLVSGTTSGEPLAKGVVVLYGETPTQSGAESLQKIRSNAHYAGLPVVAVSANPTPAVRAQLMASGASMVLDAEVGPRLILDELENRCDLEPVMKELREQLLEPFIEGTHFTLSEMINVESAVHDVFRKPGYRIFGDYSAVVGLTAETEGTLVLSFPRETAHDLGARMLAPLGEAPTEELIQSSIAEVTNIIVGQAKGRLSGTAYHFNMSTPTVVAGLHHEIRYEPGLPCLVAQFSGDVGDFALQLCMSF
jgi:chemotaxis protein CheX